MNNSEIKSVKIVQFVAVAITFIAKLSESFKPLVERAKKVATVPENETDEAMAKRLTEGLLLMIDASIIVVQHHAETVSDPAKKEELMQSAWRIRSFGDYVSKAMKTLSENGSIGMSDTMELVRELQQMTSPENIGNVKVVKLEEEVN